MIVVRNIEVIKVFGFGVIKFFDLKSWKFLLKLLKFEYIYFFKIIMLEYVF